MDDIYEDWRNQVVEDELEQYGVELFDIDWDELLKMSEDDLREKALKEMDFPGASIEGVRVVGERE